MRSSENVAFIRGASSPQRAVEVKQRAVVKSTFSRRGVFLTTLSTLGIMLLPKSATAEDQLSDKDLLEKLLEEIDNLQNLVTKSFDNAKETVTTKAEEALSSLDFGQEKAAEDVTVIENLVEGTAQENKLALE
jgi:hypothetical protein